MDLINLEIHDIAFGGKGVGRHEGMVVFVPFTIPGERVRARVVRRKKRFAEAELLEVLEASPDRVEPPCPYFTLCGGCSYQHMRYERQLAVKQRQVEQTLRRIGQLDSVPVRDTVPSPKEYGYRNRIRVHATESVLGFYAWGAPEIVDIQHCLLASDEVNAGLRRLRARLRGPGDYSIREDDQAVYFEQTNPGAAALLLKVVADLLPDGGPLLIDAFCGAGAFGRGLRDRFERVIGIEENEPAVRRARALAGDREAYLSGTVEAHLAAALREAEDVRVVLDPPAAGLSARVKDALLFSTPAEIVYVSCDPATLARDLQLLATAYRLASVTPVDMFPQTAEIEVAAHLQRR